jgi:hypothetical protein
MAKKNAEMDTTYVEMLVGSVSGVQYNCLPDVLKSRYHEHKLGMKEKDRNVLAPGYRFPMDKVFSDGKGLWIV